MDIKWETVVHELSSWSFYAELFVAISEIALANVIVSDIVYLCNSFFCLFLMNILFIINNEMCHE